jgi:hypothetical protein
VRGSFSIESLREDTWGYEYLEERMREENETDYCGGAELSE